MTGGLVVAVAVVIALRGAAQGARLRCLTASANA
ncbi:hypothetical protein QFZ39_000101 [Paraburkholderia graminis]|nr:hypothetical protein [Paraburkholderia graminis]